MKMKLCLMAEFQQKYSIIEAYISQKNYSEAAKESEKLLQEAKKNNLSDDIDRAQTKLYFCLTLTFEQNYSIIEDHILQKRYSEALKELNNLI